MRTSLIAIASAAALSLGAASSSFAGFTYATSPTYDENTTNLNTIESTAASSNITLGQFTTNVAAAHAANLGGVVTFDNATGVSVNGVVTATYGAGQGNTVAFTRSPSGDAITYDINTQAANHVSGTTGMGLAGDSNFVITPSTSLSAFGITGVSRGVDRTGRLSFTLQDTTVVTFSDELIGGINDDTFFGYVAPVGNPITLISFQTIVAGTPTASPDGTQFTRFDDLGFIVVPEPASLGLLAVGGIAVLRRRR